MIKLHRCDKPKELTASLAVGLTERFKADESSVWNAPFIRVALCISSSSKCAYCECRISDESKYLEVDHFRSKRFWPDEVVSWENLLPACKRCNVRKGSHDVSSEPIINPYDCDPKDHLALRWYRFKDLTALGSSTIAVLGLNDQARLVVKRFEIGEALHERIESIAEKLELCKIGSNTRRINRLAAQVEALLIECLPNSVYSATAATVVTTHDMFLSVASDMRILGVWSSGMQEMWDDALRISLPER